MEFKELVGKTIEAAVQMRHVRYSDRGWLGIVFTDGTEVLIESSYGQYDGKASDEYPTNIRVLDVTGDNNAAVVNELKLLEDE
jgi:hypothetical protein